MIFCVLPTVGFLRVNEAGERFRGVTWVRVSFARLGASARASRRASFLFGPAASRRGARRAGEILFFCLSHASAARRAFCLLSAVFLHQNC